jgi:hypothetical protein
MSSPISERKGENIPPGSPRRGSATSQKGREVSSAAFKGAFEIAKILSNLSNKDRLSAMQMAGAQIGLSVTTQFVATAAKQQAVINSTPKGSKGGRAPPPTKKWGADVKAKQSQIASINKAISEESEKLGKQLPSDHELVQRRDQSFRELKALKGKSSASF